MIKSEPAGTINFESIEPPTGKSLITMDTRRHQSAFNVGVNIESPSQRHSVRRYFSDTSVLEGKSVAFKKRASTKALGYSFGHQQSFFHPPDIPRARGPYDIRAVSKFNIGTCPDTIQEDQELDLEEKMTWQQVWWATKETISKYFIPLQLGVLVALIWANVDANNYNYWFGSDHEDHVSLGDWTINGHSVTLFFLINDIFMCFFFGIAMVEVVDAVSPGGALHPLRKALCPLLGTFGGMFGPIAVFFTLLSIQQASGLLESLGSEFTFAEVAKGWGICVATDISVAWLIANFTFGGNHPAVKFLLLLAVADDVGGLIVIALFYPDSAHPVEPIWLLLVLGGMVVAFALRRLKCRWWQPYIFIAGSVVWYGLLRTGVHVALALCFVVPFMPIHEPVRTPTLSRESSHGASDRTAEIQERNGDRPAGEIARRESTAPTAAEGSQDVDYTPAPGPLHNFAQAFAFPVHIGLFFFALGNAGVELKDVGIVTLNVTLALVLGKTFGIFGMGLLAQLFRLPLPEGMNNRDLFLVGVISGAGLTVALFVATEAYPDSPTLTNQAKMGALLSVLVAPLAVGLGRVFGVEKVSSEPNVEPVK